MNIRKVRKIMKQNGGFKLKGSWEKKWNDKKDGIEKEQYFLSS